MSQYLSKEEIKQWRSSLEKITLEEYAKKLGKILEEDKQTSDIIDIVMQNEKRLYTSREKAPAQKQVLKIAKRAQKVQDEILNKNQDTILGDVKSKLTCKKQLTQREDMVLAHFVQNKVLLAPAKAANAGGVATSALEMSQNSMRYSWSYQEVDKKLHEIMTNIFNSCLCAIKEYDLGINYAAAANIAAFKKVSSAMIAQGII